MSSLIKLTYLRVKTRINNYRSVKNDVLLLAPVSGLDTVNKRREGLAILKWSVISVAVQVETETQTEYLVSGPRTSDTNNLQDNYSTWRTTYIYHFAFELWMRYIFIRTQIHAVKWEINHFHIHERSLLYFDCTESVANFKEYSLQFFVF